MDYKLNENKLNKLEEFFNWIQENKNSRSWVFILLFRRLIFIILLVNLESIPSRYVIGILIFLQICYVSWVAFVRPYKEVKENLISILNEAYFSLLLVVLILFNTQEDWNQVKINITMWILMSNSIAIFVIVIGKILVLIIVVYTIKSIFSWLMHKWHRRTVSKKYIKFRMTMNKLQ